MPRLQQHTQMDPARMLDPFLGSHTGRDYTGISREQPSRNERE